MRALLLALLLAGCATTAPVAGPRLPATPSPYACDFRQVHRAERNCLQRGCMFVPPAQGALDCGDCRCR